MQRIVNGHNDRKITWISGECATLQAVVISEHAEHAQGMGKSGKQNPPLAHLETSIDRAMHAGFGQSQYIRARLNPFPRSAITTMHARRQDSRHAPVEEQERRARCKWTTPDGGASFQGMNLLTPNHTTVPGGSSTGHHMAPRDPHSKCTSISPNHRINYPSHYWNGRHVHAYYSLNRGTLDSH
jgi:hypothetical protein